MPLKLALSVGDANGIGPELLLKSTHHPAHWQGATPVVFGPMAALQAAQSVAPSLWPMRPIAHPAQALPQHLNVVDVLPGFVPQWGTPTPASGQAALLALQAATLAVASGECHALVTLPIHKLNIRQAGFGFPGHTEYLAEHFGVHNPLMCFVLGGFRLALATTHLPLREVPDALTEALIVDKLTALHTSLRHDFGIAQPRIAVLGLNPHAGEGGLLGHEEAAVIAPAMGLAQAQGIDAAGPFAADGFFALARQLEHDATLGMYHDQGLIAFKGLTRGLGVNFTAGLPIVRTSPDHGTAFDIAGRGAAQPGSFLESLSLAAQVWRARNGAG